MLNHESRLFLYGSENPDPFIEHGCEDPDTFIYLVRNPWHHLGSDR